MTVTVRCERDPAVEIERLLARVIGRAADCYIDEPERAELTWYLIECPETDQRLAVARGLRCVQID